MNYDYICLDDLLAIHADQIKRYGGTHGVHDLGLLEAALFRPQTGDYPSLSEEAAALWESRSQNHPFVDGNKRTAFAATYVFLLISGLRISATDEGTQSFVLGLHESQQLQFEHLRRWLLDNTQPA